MNTADALLIRRARPDFIVSGKPLGVARMLSRADGNPDLAELLAYNRAGCRHPLVPQVLTAAEAVAFHAEGTFEIWETLCPTCEQRVLSAPGQVPW
jgi:hypothetical protein